MFPGDPGAKPWYVYVLYSPSHNKYYRGITSDVQRRLKQHNAGKGAKYTRGRGPGEIYALDLVAYERSGALRTEAWLRSLTKSDFMHWCSLRRYNHGSNNTGKPRH